MEKTKLFQALTEAETPFVLKFQRGEDELFTFHLMARGKLKAKLW